MSQKPGAAKKKVFVRIIITFLASPYSSPENKIPSLKKRKKKVVYPKVKVREQTDQDDQHVVADFCSTVNEYEEDISPPSIAKIPKSYIPSSIAFSFANDTPNVAIPKISALQGEDGDKNIDEDCKHNIRASSIPRPRAVLSSPDNDLVIGNKNRCKKEKTPVLKNRHLPQNRHALCKIIPTTTEDVINSKKSNENSDESKKEKTSVLKNRNLPQNRHALSKIIPTTTEDVINSKKSNEDSDESKGKKGKVVTGPTQRRQIRTGKPSSMKL
ncbi:uncharacterized protein LOC133815641 [Humulus lupulus]|uniref:uncharacterized protein LOC133815641 n=1 Tax=Humulus lupulus TaxID=3486 RepID=UPI002B40F525|nr:uncharacterized protein LOC133815641 [Humulus lupulus]